MDAPPPVFVSYSRRDYYFAESLTFHLLRGNVAAWMDVKDLEPGSDWERGLEDALDRARAVVLVVSPHSMASERVRAEWTRASQRGCRIVLVRFRSAAIPPELAGCEVVDFRGRFGKGLSLLRATLAADPAVGASGATRPPAAGWPAFPPTVWLMTVLLAIPVVGYFMAASWTVGGAPMSTLQIVSMGVVAVAAIGWFFCVAFLRRRMGMTRLAFCLLLLAFTFGLQLEEVLSHGMIFGDNNAFAAMARAHWRLFLFLMAAPLVGLVVLVFIRPEDLLRWTVTGKAWARYRLGHVATAAFGRAELAAQFREIRLFTLLHDPVDAPLAQRLREQLVAQGAIEAAGDAGVTPALLLSNRTRVDWIAGQPSARRADSVTIVGSAIGLPAELAWVWRRQWIDFRAWNIAKRDPALALPQVPDGVTSPRLPGPVARFHHVLCAVAALVLVIATGLLPEESRRSSTLSTAEAVAYFAMAAGLWWALIAHRVVKRSRTAASLSRDLQIAWVITPLAIGLVMVALNHGKLNGLRMALVLFALAGAFLWLAKARPGLDFWMPAQNATRTAAKTALGRFRNWATLGWIFAYACVWMLALGFVQ